MKIDWRLALTIAAGLLAMLVQGCSGSPSASSPSSSAASSPSSSAASSTSSSSSSSASSGSPPGSGAPVTPGTVSTGKQITQYGVTWTFANDTLFGQFANGDYWVLGPVTITAVTPAFDGTHHGMDINPTPIAPDPTLPSWQVGPQRQGYDARAGSFDAASVPALPYTAQPGASIIKAVSRLVGQACESASPSVECLQTAVVLTVLGAIPPDNGASVFRPPYVGTQKPLYSVTSLQLGLLPSLPSVPSAGSLDGVRNRFQRVQLDHLEFSPGRFLHPVANMPSYGGDIGRDNADGALRLMLADTTSAKLPALINYVQMGIDHYHMARLGMRWQAQGGNSPGRRITLAFTAAILGNAEMKQFSQDLLTIPGAFAGVQGLHEDGLVSIGQGGRALYGSADTEANYWSVLYNHGASGNKSIADPYGFIDGGPAPGGPYQTCCTSAHWKGEVLAALLMPSIQQAWSKTLPVFAYVERMASVGLWAQPDPCAPESQGGGSAGPGRCILDPDLTPGSTMEIFSCQPGKACGRFPERHGMAGPQGTALVEEMWAYRPGP